MLKPERVKENFRLSLRLDSTQSEHIHSLTDIEIEHSEQWRYFIYLFNDHACTAEGHEDAR